MRNTIPQVTGTSTFKGLKWQQNSHPSEATWQRSCEAGAAFPQGFTCKQDVDHWLPPTCVHYPLDSQLFRIKTLAFDVSTSEQVNRRQRTKMQLCENELPNVENPETFIYLTVDGLPEFSSVFQWSSWDTCPLQITSLGQSFLCWKVLTSLWPWTPLQISSNYNKINVYTPSPQSSCTDFTGCSYFP